MSLDISDPRTSGRAAIKMTVDQVDSKLWEKNRTFGRELQGMLQEHAIANHKLLDFFKTETLSIEKSLHVHLEFGYAFAQIFTDAVIQAMFQASQLESRLGPQGKATARFLWALNLQDELGYFPSGSKENYSGHPFAAHYFQYVSLFKQLGTSENAIASHTPRDASVLARRSFEGTYESYRDVTTILALAESIFDEFAGPWAQNVGRSTQVDVTEGYHTIHVEDEHGDSIDDDHSEDSWTLFAQAVTEDDYSILRTSATEWMNSWSKFTDELLTYCES